VLKSIRGELDESKKSVSEKMELRAIKSNVIKQATARNPTAHQLV
jgi:hypothetical protein